MSAPGGTLATQAAREWFRLDGRVALVTGAFSGLGARFATVLRQAGADVVLTARRQDPLQRLANDLGARATVFAHDLREPTVRATLVEPVTNRSGRRPAVPGAAVAGPVGRAEVTTW
jgi:NAD(P)-dependent dehydrogenase (short-subunit alcohol dehydrogenase family)